MKIRAIFEAAALYEGNADNKQKKRDVEKAQPFNRHERDKRKAEVGPVDRKSPKAKINKELDARAAKTKESFRAQAEQRVITPRVKADNCDYNPKNSIAEIELKTFPFTVGGKRVMVDATASFKIHFDREGYSDETLKSITADDHEGNDVSGTPGIRDTIEQRGKKVLERNWQQIEKKEGAHRKENPDD